jgi:DNA-binding GntR family transcriptional regulator
MNETETTTLGDRDAGSISRSNLKDEVAVRIREQIFTGELLPSERVDQERLAAMWGISKLPVREALIALEAEGLVNNIARRGSFVVPLTASEIHIHYHVFGLVAGYAAELAATALSAADLERLEDVNEKMAASSDAREHETLNFEFHRIIDQAPGSARLNAVLRVLSQSMPREFFQLTVGWHKEAVSDHRLILAALKARDGGIANSAMLNHMVKGGQRAVIALEEAWSRRGSATA